ncbi:hypothetical protein [Bacillus sp. SJS]|uniref:hypothetical protein n=1 Tax=Bacillus sp. SJS TaxID=1423321 RepID=UPI0004DD5CAA|nr:hypothetical protein [Bacillus sp. SJS]KZZ86225.1 hypothetical protein AS29_001225 [Bacillus sp. SJS]
MYYVYIHKDKLTKEVVYVGKGSNYRYCGYNSRSNEHIAMMKEKKLDYIILKYFDDEEEAYKYEEKITAAYKKFNQCKFNISIGRRISEETKIKLSKVLSGKKRSNETKDLMKKNHARYNAKQVSLYKDGILIRRFNSSREAGIFASTNGICSYGWVGRSLKTGEITKVTKYFPNQGFRFVYDDDRI